MLAAIWIASVFANGAVRLSHFSRVCPRRCTRSRSQSLRKHSKAAEAQVWTSTITPVCRRASRAWLTSSRLLRSFFSVSLSNYAAYDTASQFSWKWPKANRHEVWSFCTPDEPDGGAPMRNLPGKEAVAWEHADTAGHLARLFLRKGKLRRLCAGGAVPCSPPHCSQASQCGLVRRELSLAERTAEMVVAHKERRPS